MSHGTAARADNRCMVFSKRARKVGNVLTLRVENSLRFPYTQKQDKDAQTDDGGGDIDQPWAVKSSHQKLGETEADA